jgi:hypothetical protein
MPRSAGRKAFQEAIGCRRVTSTMAILQDGEAAFAKGYISKGCSSRSQLRSQRPEIAVNMPQLAHRVFAGAPGCDTPGCGITMHAGVIKLT